MTLEYLRYHALSWHDNEPNDLKRWFDNYKLDRHSQFAGATEWLFIADVLADTPSRKVRFVCEIGDDVRGTRRHVVMDHTAPPPTASELSAQRRWQPGTAKEVCEAQERVRLVMAGCVAFKRMENRTLVINNIQVSVPSLMQPSDDNGFAWIVRGDVAQHASVSRPFSRLRLLRNT